MGTVQSSTVVIVSGSISTNSKLEQKWLTLGITAQSSSSGTCTTLTETVPWTNLILNAWPSATPSSRARVTGMRLLSKRTKRSWLTWNEIAELADFNKDGEVSSEEFIKGIDSSCTGKSFNELPNAFTFFIDASFRTIDVDGDGSVGLTEFRVDCVNRMAYKSIGDLDAAYNKLLNDEDKKVGGITLARYQELYAQFIGNPDEKCPAVDLFGPLEVIN